MQRYTLSELEAYIRTIDAAGYARTRNYIGGSTELSEYITRGMISLPRVRQLILESTTPKQAGKLINELAWREYWHSVWYAKGDAIFDYFKAPPQPDYDGIPTAVIEARTGIAALDDGIRQLRDTGYIHNHMRMWLAGLVCNVAHCDWRVGADWMHAQLIDGDYASNHLSWQWVAGCYTGRPYLPQQDNINRYTNTKQHGTYLDHTYEHIADMPVPAELADRTTTLPEYASDLPASTTSLETVQQAKTILLYSPWTLDPTWQRDTDGCRVLLLDPAIYTSGAFSQPVLDSIAWFAGQVPDLQVLHTSPLQLQDAADRIRRQAYPGIVDWPGQVDPAEQLFPEVPAGFYRSFSAYWKQVQKHSRQPGAQ